MLHNSSAVYSAIAARDPDQLLDSLRRINADAAAAVDHQPTTPERRSTLVERQSYALSTDLDPTSHASALAQHQSLNLATNLDPTQPIDTHNILDPLVSPVEYAVQQNFTDGVRILLHDVGPVTRQQSADVLNALRIATARSQPEIIRVFLEAALQLNDLELRKTVNISAVDVLRHAIDFGELHDVALRAISSPELDVNATLDVLDHRLLAYVAMRGHARLVDAMLHRGAVVDAPAGDGSTALMHAALEASLPCCRVLLQHGADPNHRAPLFAFASPLQAVFTGRLRKEGRPEPFAEFLELLFSAGLNVSREGKWVLEFVRRVDATLLNADVADARRIDAQQSIGVANDRRIDAQQSMADARRPGTEQNVDVASAGASKICHPPGLKDLRDRLVELRSNPHSLSVACSVLIRRHLSDVGRGMSIVHPIGQLPLPVSYKRTLILDYLS